jgi:hypothetical protein
MLLEVQTLNGKILFKGTKHDCMQFIKRKRINRNHIKLIVPTIRKEPELIEPAPTIYNKMAKVPFFKMLRPRS